MIKVTANFELTKEQEQGYIEIAKEKMGDRADEIKEVIVTEIDKYTVDVEIISNPIKVERIRRITGYLVGTVDRWGNGKQSELKERVKHSL